MHLLKLKARIRRTSSLQQHRLLAQKHGFIVTSPALGLATSFESTYGFGGRLVVFNAEYDTQPSIGHARGHNLGTSSAAFLAVAHHIRHYSKPSRVRLLGMPAEEGGGGRIKLLSAGAFKDVDTYQENQYKSLSPSTIALTQSLETGLVWFLGLPVGLLFSRCGARPPLIVGTLFHIFGLMMLSLLKQYYQVVLS
jgi:hypothetical protein